MLNPWAVARQAEQRAAAAEERAAYLEGQLRMLWERLDVAREGQVTALKINANVASQRAFGFIPYPEVVSVPPPEEREIRELDTDQDIRMSAVDRELSAFKRREMELFRERQAAG
ncbi:MAG TPA: hypothetical protein VE958_08080 [Bryobacteraceae bacterium]|nr:hypothetical protein [Bryobacteraceae bacterium]